MNCERNCPKIAAFNAQLSGLFERMDSLIRQNETLSAVAISNADTRDQLTNPPNMVGRYAAMRALSDAEFHQKEAVSDVSAALVAVDEAIELTVNAKDVTLATCPAGGPIKTTNSGPECALDYCV